MQAKTNKEPVIVAAEFKEEKWIANPKVVEVEPGDELVFDAGTHSAQIWIPNNDKIQGVFLKEFTGKSDPFPVNDIGAGNGDRIPYGFYLRDNNVMLEGDSPPHIIIKKR